MKYVLASLSAVLLALPAFAGAQAYYYTPTSYGYPQQQQQQQYQYGGYQYQSAGYQYQPQNSQPYFYRQLPSYAPPSGYGTYGSGGGYGPNGYYYGNPPYGYTYGGYGNWYGQFASSYATGRTNAFGAQLCQYSDYPVATPCRNGDPQQWVQDPYTGRWY